MALADLPSSGRVYAIDPIAQQRRPALYVCTHSTDPQPLQVIHTDQSTASLLRVIKRRPPAVVPPSGGGGAAVAAGGAPGLAGQTAGGAGPRKRVGGDAAAGPSGQPAPKKQAAQSAAGGAPHKAYTAQELGSKPNKELQELLSARGLPISGRKEELARRLMDHQRAHKHK